MAAALDAAKAAAGRQTFRDLFAAARTATDKARMQQLILLTALMMRGRPISDFCYAKTTHELMKVSRILLGCRGRGFTRARRLCFSLPTVTAPCRAVQTPHLEKDATHFSSTAAESFLDALDEVLLQKTAEVVAAARFVSVSMDESTGIDNVGRLSVNVYVMDTNTWERKALFLEVRPWLLRLLRVDEAAPSILGRLTANCRQHAADTAPLLLPRSWQSSSRRRMRPTCWRCCGLC
jgi:hypothetical protein